MGGHDPHPAYVLVDGVGRPRIRILRFRRELLHEPAEGESSARLEGAGRLGKPAEVREHLIR